MKLKYLRHPLRTLGIMKAVVGARLSMRRIAYQGRRKFRADRRYDLQNVTAGFAPPLESSSDDTELLERICTAYQKAVKAQESSPEAYRSTEWWEQVTQGNLASVKRALLERDVATLRSMYRNFYRDPCSAGLLGVPYGMSQAYFGGPIKDIYRHFYLSHVLHRLDYWAAQTGGRFVASDLAGPLVGNPFGVQFGETLVRVGAEYAHYCAYRLGELLEGRRGRVAEIGGGFGGMAYYLLRDYPGITYLDFDLPESLALTSYYLMKSFPKHKFLLYGEEDMTSETMDRYNVILMPLSGLNALPKGSVDVCFSSHAMSDLSTEALDIYLDNIARFTRNVFLYVGNRRASDWIATWVTEKSQEFKLIDSRSSCWDGHKVPGSGVAASMMYEQCYARKTTTKQAELETHCRPISSIKEAGHEKCEPIEARVSCR